MIFDRRAGFLAALLVVGCVTSIGKASEQDIDSLLAGAHKSAGVSPLGICDDATFMRRISLDLIGRVPSELELTSFLSHPDRESVVVRLLESPEHAIFWSQLWTSMLLGRGQMRGVERELLRSWIEDAISHEKPLNELAFELITASGVTALDGPVNFVAASRSDPVMRLSRTFLSVQLDCAQCHDHPHDRWTNGDYQSMQRFYSLTRFREVSGGIAVSDDGPDPNDPRPRFLTGRQPHTSAWRRELGLMVVTSKPFSRAMVNRTWHWLMGRGIIDPVDGLSRDNPAALPELLESMAGDLRESGFALRPLIQQICLSDAYQRQSLPADRWDSSEREAMLSLFAARSTRPLLPEQWLSSVAQVLDQPIPSPADLAAQSSQLLGVSRQSTPAIDPFAWSPNSQSVIRQLSVELPIPLRNPDSLFLVTLARRPTVEERSALTDHDTQDLVFALVHSNEFMTND